MNIWVHSHASLKFCCNKLQFKEVEFESVTGFWDVFSFPIWMLVVGLWWSARHICPMCELWRNIYSFWSPKETRDKLRELVQVLEFSRPQTMTRLYVLEQIKPGMLGQKSESHSFWWVLRSQLIIPLAWKPKLAPPTILVKADLPKCFFRSESDR